MLCLDLISTDPLTRVLRYRSLQMLLLVCLLLAAPVVGSSHVSCNKASFTFKLRGSSSQVLLLVCGLTSIR